MNKWINNHEIESGWKQKYTWKIKPDGDWTNGNAPINLIVSYSKEGIHKPIEFTIANPHILDEQYSGLNIFPTHTTTNPSSSDQTPSQGSPGFGVVGTMLGIAFVVVAMRD